MTTSLVTRHTGTLLHWYTASLVHCFTGALLHWYTGTLLHWYTAQLSMPTLHFSIGPVQGFIAETRRVRDLWASSFLLSWLSAHAMQVVIDGGRGEIVFPEAHDDPVLKALSKNGGAPFIGTVPNRFKAKSPDLTAGETAAIAVRDKWRELANAVWDEFVGKHAKDGTGTRDIWDRQVEKGRHEPHQQLRNERLRTLPRSAELDDE